jgi:hypothetical protein
MNNQTFSCKKHSGLNGTYWTSVFKTKRLAPRKFLKQHSSSHKCRRNHKYLLPNQIKSIEEDVLALQNCISENLLKVNKRYKLIFIFKLKFIFK